MFVRLFLSLVLLFGVAVGAHAQVISPFGEIIGGIDAAGPSYSANNILSVSANTTLSEGKAYYVNTTSAAVTLTFPSCFTDGTTIQVVDQKGTFGTNNVTLVPASGGKINGVTTNTALSTNHSVTDFECVSAENDWKMAAHGGAGGIAVETNALTQQSASAATTLTDSNVSVSSDASAAAFTITLPSASANLGKSIEVIKTDTTALSPRSLILRNRPRTTAIYSETLAERLLC